ncbi:MAG: metallophosphoesterase [Acidobacteria bacterium]|nr:metallophosphoesterase [Acidobacteriota bacterium]
MPFKEVRILTKGRLIKFVLVLCLISAPGILIKSPSIAGSTPQEMQKISVDQLFIKSVEIQPEAVKQYLNIKVRTKFPMMNGRFYYGVIMNEANLPLHTYRFIAKDDGEPGELKRDFNFNIDLDELWDFNFYPENKKYKDLTVYYRIKLFDKKYKQDRILDGNFSIRRENGKFRRIPSIVLGPVIDCVTENSAVLSWEADGKESWDIDLWTINDKKRRAPLKPGEPITTPGRQNERFEVDLTNLKPGTKYFYRVRPADSESNPSISAYPLYHFKTIPQQAETREFEFAVIGDSQAGPPYLDVVSGVNLPVLKQLSLQTLAQEPAFVVHAGDMVDGCTDDIRDYYLQHEMYYRAVAPLAAYIPVYEIIGNHDSYQDWFAGEDKKTYHSASDPLFTEGLFSSMFVSPQNSNKKPSREIKSFNGKHLQMTAPEYSRTLYSFKYGNSYFIALNSSYLAASIEFNQNYPGYYLEEQMKWLERELKTANSTPGIRHIFVFSHHPNWPPTYYSDNKFYKDDKPVPLRSMSEKLFSLFRKYNITALVSGHHHLFAKYELEENNSRGEKVWQIITGSGGSANYPRASGTKYKIYDNLTREAHYLLFEVKGENVTCIVKNIAGIELLRVILR